MDVENDEDYGLYSDILIIYYGNSSVTNISKNHVQYFHTKHIDIRHYFICDLVEKNIVRSEHIATKVDIFTKTLNFERFSNLRKSLSMCMV